MGMTINCPLCPYYVQKTSYGTEVVKCNNEECQYNVGEPQESEGSR